MPIDARSNAIKDDEVTGNLAALQDNNRCSHGRKPIWVHAQQSLRYLRHSNRHMALRITFRAQPPFDRPSPARASTDGARAPIRRINTRHVCRSCVVCRIFCGITVCLCNRPRGVTVCARDSESSDRSTFPREVSRQILKTGLEKKHAYIAFDNSVASLQCVTAQQATLPKPWVPFVLRTPTPFSQMSTSIATPPRDNVSFLDSWQLHKVLIRNSPWRPLQRRGLPLILRTKPKCCSEKKKTQSDPEVVCAIDLVV